MNRRTAAAATIVMLLLASGCGQADREERQAQPIVSPVQATDGGKTKASAQAEDFVLELLTHKAEYASGEAVDLTARLKYDGEHKAIEIQHAASPLSFHIRETTRDIEIMYVMNQPLISTKLKKGIWFEEPYEKTGGYGDSDPNKAFIKAFLQGKAFPTGTYEISASASFDAEGEDVAFRTEPIFITVK